MGNQFFTGVLYKMETFMFNVVDDPLQVNQIMSVSQWMIHIHHCKFSAAAPHNNLAVFHVQHLLTDMQMIRPKSIWKLLNLKPDDRLPCLPFIKWSLRQFRIDCKYNPAVKKPDRLKIFFCTYDWLFFVMTFDGLDVVAQKCHKLYGYVHWL